LIIYYLKTNKGYILLILELAVFAYKMKLDFHIQV